MWFQVCYINRTTEYPFNGYPVFKTTTTDNKQDLTNNYCVYNIGDSTGMLNNKANLMSMINMHRKKRA